VVVEDDERALDEADVPLDLPTSCASNLPINCFPQGDDPQITTCYPSALTFTTSDLLDAAQQCNANITTSTPVVFSASGAAGGRGADVWPFDGGPGGEGGLAALGTTLEQLDEAFGSGTAYCYGIGQAGGHTDTAAGAGGASTILRTCDNVSQTETTGVLLIAGGGGGGAIAETRGGGGDGGVAYSGTDGPCPGSCILDTVPRGEDGQYAPNGTGGGSGLGGAAFNSLQASGPPGGDGNDGVGGAGGYVPGFGTAYWQQGDPQVGVNPNTGINAGQGGENCNPDDLSTGSTASGGGGYGGGSGVPYPGNGGGGGGGSYAAQSTLDNIDSSQWSRSAGGGWIYILFGPQP
jgi:hypothetical protein